MSIFNIFRRKSSSPQDLLGPKTGDGQDRTPSLAFGGVGSGVYVDPERSLGVAAVFSAARVLAEDVAGLPLPLYFKDGSSRRRADWRDEYALLNSQPNSYQTAFSLREVLMASLVLWGNAYCEIERNLDGRVKALHFIEPSRVKIKRTSDDIFYQVDKKTLTKREVFHVHAFSTDGIEGRSVVRLARESIGLSISTEKFGASYFGNGATPGGVLEVQKKLNKEAIDRLRESWNNRYQGPHKSGGVAVLEEGMTFKQVGIPPEDSQFLETRRFQVTEIARWFRIPPHMIGDLEHATFSNIEHQGLEYVVHTLRPWLIRIEQEAQIQLLDEEIRGVYYWEHLVDGLLRGDIESRYQAYATGRQWGWLSANDIRRLENMNPINGGDEYLVPLNMTNGEEKNDGK
jgi:HK97 family phage portal protein